MTSLSVNPGPGQPDAYPRARGVNPPARGGSHPSKTPRPPRRTVPGMSEQTIFPTLRYQDAPAAIEWLGRAFGF